MTHFNNLQLIIFVFIGYSLILHRSLDTANFQIIRKKICSHKLN